MYTTIFFHLRAFCMTGVMLWFCACQNTDSKIDKKNEIEPINSTKVTIDTTKSVVSPPKPDTLEQKIMDAGLVDIQKINPGIAVELKYASTDNFMNKNVYGSLKKAYLQPDVAKSLSEAQDFLKSIDSSLTLLVYDAVRPRSVQQYMWDYLELPISEKVKFVSNPKNGSVHNYGSAVDLTISYVNGEPLDMGAGYDEIDRIAYPKFESEFLKKGLSYTSTDRQS